MRCHPLGDRTLQLDTAGVGGLRQAQTVITCHPADGTNTIHLDTATSHCPCSKLITNRINNPGATALEFEHQAPQSTDVAYCHVVIGGNSINGIHGLHITDQTTGSASCREAEVDGISVTHRLRETDAEGLNPAVTFTAWSRLDHHQQRPHPINQQAGTVRCRQREVHIRAFATINVGEAAAIGKAQAGGKGDATGAAQFTLSNGVGKNELITGSKINACLIWHTL